MRTRPRSVRPFVARTLVAAGLLVARHAAADGVSPVEATPEQKSAAMSHFTAGKRALDARNWNKSADELRASIGVVDSPNARLELARALRDSDKAGEAWAEYGRVVDSATKLAAREERYAKTAEAAKGERAALEAKLAFVTVALSSAPPDATLKAAGRQVPREEWASPIVVPAGAVDVVLSDASGKDIARQTVSAQAGAKTAVALDLQAAAPPKPVEPPPDADLARASTDVPPPPSDASKLRPYAYVAGGIGVVGFALFGIFGLMDNSTYSDLQNACAHNVCPPSKQGELDSGRTQQTVANVGLVVGAVGVAASATLFIVSASSKSSPSTGLLLGPGFVGWTGSL
jgi:hypothetical protein